MPFSNRYPPIAVAVQALVLSTQLFGILGNTFFITILLRHHRGWNAGKILLLAYHAGALVFLTSVFGPLLVVVCTGRELSSRECTALTPFVQASALYLPLSLAVSAHYRRKLVQATTDSREAPNVKRYVYMLLAVVAVATTVSNLNPGDKPMWSPAAMTCLRFGTAWVVLFNMSFFGIAPYFFYCYWKIVSVIREYTQDGGAEFVRVIVALTVFFYITYLPLYSVLFFDVVLGMSVVPNIGHQIMEWAHITHTAFSPVVSIMLTDRYRRAAKAIFNRRTINSMDSSHKEISMETTQEVKESDESTQRQTDHSDSSSISQPINDLRMSMY